MTALAAIGDDAGTGTAQQARSSLLLIVRYTDVLISRQQMC